ncbi:MAG: glycosyltransferase [Candidatus Cloacimonadota bacterium]|nr:glycosyltransferase [Candidatus Cloacimonadota bacterium]
MNPKIEVVVSKNGLKIPVINHTNIHSIYDPIKEGNKIIDKHLDKIDESSLTIVLGLGFGYHLNRLVKQNIEFLVYEPDIDLISLALENNEKLKEISIISQVESLPYNISEDNIIVLPSEFRINKKQFNIAINHLTQKKQIQEKPSNKDVRILIDYPIYGGSMTTAKYITSAFESLGYSYKIVDNSNANDLLQSILKMNKVAQQQLSEKLIELLSNLFWIELQNYNPDLVVFNAQSPITVKLLKSLKKNKISTAFWFVEDFRRFPYWKTIAPNVDFFFTIQKDEFYEKLKKAKVDFYEYLPMAAANIHQKLEITKIDKIKYGSDVSFMGAGFLNRHNLFSKLRSYNLKIWGNGWENNPKLAENIQNNGERVSVEETIKIYNSSKININLHSSMGDSLFDEHKDFINPRTFEIAACGGFQIVDRRSIIDEIFVEDKDIVCFDSVAELREKIDYYLSHGNERERIAQAGQKKVLENHTYEIRINNMMDIVFKNSKNFRNRIFSRANKENKLLEDINDEQFTKFWDSLTNQEKENIALIEEKIDRRNGNFEDYEVILKLLRTF